MLTTLALMSLCLVFGGVIGISIRNRDRDKNELSCIDELLEQVKWLPISRIVHRRCDEKGFPCHSLFIGTVVPILELDGGIRLIAEDKPINSAFLEYRGTRIGLSLDERQDLGSVFKNRVAEMALASAETKLLSP